MDTHQQHRYDQAVRKLRKAVSGLGPRQKPNSEIRELFIKISLDFHSQIEPWQIYLSHFADPKLNKQALERFGHDFLSQLGAATIDLSSQTFEPSEAALQTDSSVSGQDGVHRLWALDSIIRHGQYAKAKHNVSPDIVKFRANLRDAQSKRELFDLTKKELDTGTDKSLVFKALSDALFDLGWYLPALRVLRPKRNLELRAMLAPHHEQQVQRFVTLLERTKGPAAKAEMLIIDD